MVRYYDDELYHHGIKGQRWGVRRFQNPDGSLKSAGRQRYSSTELIKQHQANGRNTARYNPNATAAEKRAVRRSKFLLPGVVPRNQKKPLDVALAQRSERKAARKQERADRAKTEAATAHKLADKYTSAMDAKAAKRQAQADEAAKGERKGFSDRQKRALKVGAVAVAAGLAAYGAHKYVKSTNAQAHKAVEDVFNNQMAKERFYGKIDAIGKGMEGAAAEKYVRNTALSASRNIYTYDQRQAHMKGLAKDLRRYQAGQARDKVLNKMNIKTARSSANPLDLYRDYYINEIENANKYRYKRVGKF